MQIVDFQKVTLVDYPGKIATTVFTRGCNFRCSFCHNPELVVPDKFSPTMVTDKFYQFLLSRQGKIDAVCITGGEPLLHLDIIEFITKIHNMGFKIKLDTNGSFPDRLKNVIDSGYIDYIAMDIKSSADKYLMVSKSLDFDHNTLAGDNPFRENTESELANQQLMKKIKKSIKLIMNSGIDYEFRTTVCHPYHKINDFFQIGEMIKGAKRYFLQNFVPSKHVDSSIIFSPLTDKEMEQATNIMKEYVKNVSIR